MGLLQATEIRGLAGKDAGAVGRATSDFSLDDLLGLGADPVRSEGSESATPFSDPFQVILVSAQDVCCSSAMGV